jgi:chromosome partitioning protein
VKTPKVGRAKRPMRPIRRILCSSPKGGSGKTMVARNLAAAAAHDGIKVVTADLDPQATLTIWSRRRPNDVPTIPHYKVVWSDAEALLDNGELGEFELLVIDTPPSIETQPSAFRKLLGAADLVVVPARATFDDAESVAPFLKLLREDKRSAVIVLNFVKPRVNINAVKSYLIDVGELCPIEIADRTDYARAGAKGLALVDIPNHPGADEVLAMWRFTRRRLWGESLEATKA